MQYFASTIPVMREATLLQRSGARKPKRIKVEAPEFVGSLEPGDELWLGMGSTNAAVTVGAHRRGATVHQVSHARALPHVIALRNGSAPGNGRVKIAPDDMWHLAGGEAKAS